MKGNLNSSLWTEAKEQIRKCHLSLLQPETAEVKAWKEAFDLLMRAIEEERQTEALFAMELAELTEATGFDYNFEDILEEYFIFLEEREEWETMIASCDKIVDIFSWEKAFPSEFMFRKGDALDRLGRVEEAETFGKQWLESYPEDYFAAASNVFLMISMGKTEEALVLTEQYIRKDLICDKATDTFYMAANRLYEITDNPHAKERVAKKIAEYDAIKAMVEE